LEYANLAFFGYFVVEIILRLLGQGFHHYFMDRYNWFDISVVIISAIDIIFSYSGLNSESGSGAITALRIFRLSRIFSVGKIWKDFQDLMSAIKKTLKDISNITILVVIFVFTFMLIGLELYAYRVSFND
jgi:voltage-gated sodium channel type II alpha